MKDAASAHRRAAIDEARALLALPVDDVPNVPWKTLAAAGFAATAAVVMAGVVVFGPGVSLAQTAMPAHEDAQPF